MQPPDTALPPDLIDRGFVLIDRNPPRLYAVAERYGGTLVYTDLSDVIRACRQLVAWHERATRMSHDDP